MKVGRLIEKVGKLLSADRRKQEARRAKLRSLLKEMKQRARELAAEIEDSRDATERAELEQKLQVLTEQRRKGVNLYRDLKRSEQGIPVDASDT